MPINLFKHIHSRWTSPMQQNFNGNVCIQLIILYCNDKCYLTLSGNSILKFTNNQGALMRVFKRHYDPYPFCLFQYYFLSDSQPSNFQITINSVTKFLKTINKYTSHCKWAPGTAFQNITPLVVNKRIIDLQFMDKTSYHLGIHNTVCYCPSSSHYNCSIDQLGPVYPGDNLTVNLCMP